MFKTIKMTLVDGSEKDFNFLAVGSTPYRYKQLFGTDLMRDITKLVNKDLDAIGDDADFSTTDKLAFIMNCQAEKRDLNCQNFDTFVEWLDQFDASTLFEHIGDFIQIYLANKRSTSEPKKGNER